MRKPQTPAKEVWGYRLSLVKGVVSVRDGSLTLTIIPLSRGMFLPILHLVSFGARERLAASAACAFVMMLGRSRR